MSKSLTRIICVSGLIAIAGCNSPSPVQGLRVVELRHHIPGGGNAMTMTVGDVAQTAVLAILSDDREITVTPYSELMSLDTAVVTVSPEGEVTAVGNGQTKVQARYLGETAETNFFVNER